MATHVGLLHLDVNIGDAMTLKDKRRIVRSFKDRIAHKRNVSVAEVGYQDQLRRARLAVAMVGSDLRYVQGALQQVANLAGGHRGWVLLDFDIEIL